MCVSGWECVSQLVIPRPAGLISSGRGERQGGGYYSSFLSHHCTLHSPCTARLSPDQPTLSRLNYTTELILGQDSNPQLIIPRLKHSQNSLPKTLAYSMHTVWEWQPLKLLTFKWWGESGAAKGVITCRKAIQTPTAPVSYFTPSALPCLCLTFIQTQRGAARVLSLWSELLSGLNL